MQCKLHVKLHAKHLVNSTGQKNLLAAVGRQQGSVRSATIKRALTFEDSWELKANYIN